MKKQLMAFLAIITISACSLKKESTLPNTSLEARLDTYLSGAMQLHNIPGLALAVIEDGQIVYQKNLGHSSLEENTTVDENSLFRIFSATKLITATAVFQLVEKKLISLKDPITRYLEHLPDHWNHVNIAHLLSHSSGLPDIIAYDSTLSDADLMSQLIEAPLAFDAGEQFRYNQTNYWLLAQIIEQVTQISFEDFVLKNQFNEQYTGVLFSSNAMAQIDNRVTRYHYNNKAKTFKQDDINVGERGHSGNGLNITLNQMIQWNKRLEDGLLIDSQTMKDMWAPYAFTNQKDDFLHGWSSYLNNGIRSVGFTGGNLAGFRKFLDDEVTIIFFSNGYQHPGYDMIINDVSRMVLPDLKRKDLVLEAEILQMVLNNQNQTAIETYKKLLSENPGTEFNNLKWNLNGIGNVLLYVDKNPAKALKVFEINVTVHPDWWVSHADLAEGLEAAAQHDQAVVHYQKAIDLNVSNEFNYNDQMILKIKSLNKSKVNK